MQHHTAMAHIEPQQLEDNHRARNPFPLYIPPQLQNRALHDNGISSVTGTGQLQVQWEDVPSTVANNTSQGTPWNPHYTNGVNYGSDSARYPELSSDRASPVTHPSVGPAHQQGIPEHVQVMFHENPGHDYFGSAPNGVVPGPTPSTHLAPDVSQPSVESLRRLASRYIHHPDSQVDMVRMEPGSADRYKVVIVLEMAGDGPLCG